MHRLAVASVAVAFSLVTSIAQAQQITLTPQVALGALDQAAADPAFETRTLGQLAGLKSRLAAGEESFFLRKERGPHAGRYAVFLTSANANSQAIAAHTQAFPTLVKYELVGASQVGVLPTVDVLGVHYIKVKPGQGPAFEKFVTDKMAAAVGNLRPDLRFLSYKGANGGYVTIIAITNAARGKYWKNGDDSDELRAAFTPAIRALTEELKPLLVADSWGLDTVVHTFEAREWADWGPVAAAAR
jgi:hypothetical protein